MYRILTGVNSDVGVPSTYLVIPSCVSKICLKIMASRVEKYMSTNNLWCINQCGFKKDHRTEDNLFLFF